MKNLLVVLMALGTLSANANTVPDPSSIATDYVGQILRFRYTDAKNYCLGQDMRLPTTREVSLLAQINGARTRETKYPSASIANQVVKDEIKAMQTQFFKPIYIQNESQEYVVNFYYNLSAYKNKYGASLENFIWTSDRLPENPFSGVVLKENTAYAFNGWDGDIDLVTEGTYYVDHSATICVPN